MKTFCGAWSSFHNTQLSSREDTACKAIRLKRSSWSHEPCACQFNRRLSPRWGVFSRRKAAQESEVDVSAWDCKESGASASKIHTHGTLSPF